MQQRWDIFCTVIDNFGDAGVCWRLARQLAAEYGLQVRLWIDDLRALQQLWPAVSAALDTQQVAGVTIKLWRADFTDVDVADVVIEAFACTLPTIYRDAMAQRAHAPVWLNLEYLSAEAWVTDCHGLASPQAGGALNKYFFFPGFGAGTGGLLCERDLRVQREAFQADAGARKRFLAAFGMHAASNALLISLFAYASAPVSVLLEALISNPGPVLCLIPEGPLLSQVAAFFGVPAPAPGAVLVRGALTVGVLPFLRQDDYDRLLWSCDINCVRGEDSFVRAQWAARPLFWQIYPQQDDAHWAKLDAFREIYLPVLPAGAAAALTAAWQAWNGRGDLGQAWRDLYPLLPALRKGAQDWEKRLHGGTNLAASLVQFCANHV
jgi:uncharacterized repeat protein (TIGR03837 family)